MAKANAPVAMVPLTAADRAQFGRDARAMLALRGPAWFAEQSWGTAEPAFAALVSLVGMYGFGWPAAAVFAFTLASLWNGVLCDFAKVAFARVAVFRSAAQHNESTRFWAIAEAIRGGKDGIREDSLRAYHPGTGLLVDVVFGGVGTAVILGTHAGDMRDVFEAFAGSDGTRLALLAMLGTQWLATVATIVGHRRPGPHAPMRFAAGMRGAGLFVLMFAALVIEDGVSVAGIVLAMNVGLLLLAALSMLGMALLRRETEWLRGELAKGRDFTLG